MLLLELAFQGVRDLPAARLELRPNGNGILSSPPAAEALVRALQTLLGARATVAAAPGAPLAQGAATLVAADRAVFRLARDLTSGRPRLWSYDARARGYTPVSEDAVEVAQFVQSRLGFCDAATYDRVFVFDARDLPSRGGAPRGRASGEDEAGRRLVDIEAQLASAAGVGALELELDALQHRRFAIEDELRGLADPEAEVARAQAALARVAAVPPDLAERYGAHRRLVARRDEDLARWESERSRIAREGAPAASGSIARHPWLWGGLAAGVVSALLGVLLGGRLRFIALLDIPALGVAATILWRHFDRRDRTRSRDRRLALHEERRQKIVARDAAEIRGVEQQLDALGVQAPEEVLALVTSRRMAEEGLRAAFASRAESGAGARRQALQREQAELDGKIAGLEDSLFRAGVGVDLGALRAEAAALRAAGGSPAAVEPAASVPLLFEQLVRAASDLWLIGTAEAQERLERLASDAVRTMTAGQLASMVLSPSPAVTTAEGQTFGVEQLPAETRDTLYVALRVALVRGCDERQRMPVVIVDAPDAGWMPAVVFAELAPAGQVLLVTTEASRLPGDAPALRLPA